MAQFTWRDVAAPDFSGAAKGFTDAGQLLTDSIGKAISGISGFDKGQDDKAAQALALYIAQHPDATSLQGDVAAGKVGGLDLTNRHVASAVGSMLSPDRINSMLTAERAQAAGSRAESDAITAFTQRRSLDELSPELLKMQMLHQSGNRAGALAIAESLPWQRLGYKTASDLLDAGVNQDRTAASDSMTAFSNNNTLRNDRVGREAQNLVETLRPQAGTPEELSFLVRERLRGREGEEDFGMLSDRVNDLIGAGAFDPTGNAGAAGPAMGGGSGAGGFSAASADRVVGDVMQFDKPPSQMTVGEWKTAGEKLIQATKNMSPEKRAQLGLKNGEGSSAMGTFQILGYSTAQDYAKKLGWSADTVMTPARQEQMAAAIWNDARGGDASAVYASLPKKPPGFYKDVSWDEIKGQLAAGESGGSLSTLQGNAVATQAASAVEGAAQDPTGIASRMLAAATTKGDLDTVSRQVATDYGMKEKDANQTLNMIIQRGKNLKGPSYPSGINLTPAQAFEIFKESRRNEGFGGALLGWADQDNAAGKGMRVKDSIIDETIKTYASPQAIQQTVREAERSRLQAGNSAGLQTFTAAYENYKRAATSAALNRDYNPALLQRAKDQLIAAGRTAQVGQSALEKFLNPQYFGDTSLISSLRVGNDTNTRAVPTASTASAPVPVARNRGVANLIRQASIPNKDELYGD
jgi:hypothetical protein